MSIVRILEIIDRVITARHCSLNTLRPRQNGRHFADDYFKCIFSNENVRITIKISMKFVPKRPINNIPALVRIMAWHQLGNKPLSEPMVVRLQNAYMSLGLNDLNDQKDLDKSHNIFISSACGALTTTTEFISKDVLFMSEIRPDMFMQVTNWDVPTLTFPHQGPLLLTWFNFNPSMDK